MNITNFGKKVSFKKTLDYCLPPSPRIFIPSLDLFSAKDVILKCACAISWVNVFLDLQFLQKWNEETKFTLQLNFYWHQRAIFSQLMIGRYGKSGEVITTLNTLNKFALEFCFIPRLGYVMNFVPLM